MKKIIHYTCFIIIACIVNLYSDEIPAEYSKNNLKKFIRYLDKNEEYYRAYSELLRFESYYGLSNELDISRQYFIYRGGQIELSIDVNKIYGPKKIYYADYYYKNLLYSKLKQIDSTEYELLNFYIYKRKFASKLFATNYHDIKIPVNYEKYFNKKLLSNLGIYSETIISQKKNIGLALAAGIIPGMGYYYSGDKKTGVLSFFLITALSVFTYYSWTNENRAIGIFTGSISFFFYGGSIIGGAIETGKFNRTLEKKLNIYLYQKMKMDKDLIYVEKQFGLGVSNE